MSLLLRNATAVTLARRSLPAWARGLAGLALALAVGVAAAQAASAGDTPPAGPIVLRQTGVPAVATPLPRGTPVARPAYVVTAPEKDAPPSGEASAPTGLKPGDEWPSTARNRPSEFERYVQKLANSFDVRRLGAELALEPGATADAADSTLPIPPDYVVAPGDEVQVSMWGSVEADLKLVVDRGGRIQLPRVGAVQLAGLKARDIAPAIERQARRLFKNFELSASLTQLRSVRVYVTGYAERPGTYVVNSLTSVSALVFRAGGPADSGSFRNVELRRHGQAVARFDLYDLIVHGRRDADQLIQPDDVVHIGPVGRQVAVIGSVNRPAIVELKGGETLADAMQLVGGFSSVADRSRLAVERLDDRSGPRIRQLAWPIDQTQSLGAGDVVRVFSAVAAVLPQQLQNKRVQIDGEVLKPGEYILPADATIGQLVAAAGGLTDRAFLFGTEFRRESARQSQQQYQERLTRDLEVEVARAMNANAGKPSTDASITTGLVGDRLLQRLRTTRPSGRVVLQLPPDAQALPEMLLEDGDRLYIPPRPTSVAVFGSVYNGGNYLYASGRSIQDYLRLAGSATREADDGSIFVVRANGTVESARQRRKFMNNGTEALAALPAMPGDTIVVPDEVNKPSTTQNLKDWAQIVYQFVLGLGALKSL